MPFAVPAFVHELDGGAIPDWSHELVVLVVFDWYPVDVGVVDVVVVDDDGPRPGAAVVVVVPLVVPVPPVPV